MKVTFSPTEARISFDYPPPPEKDQVKGLGARWNGDGKYWRLSLTPTAINWLEEHDIQVPENLSNSVEEQLNASRATSTDLELTCPDGLDYRPFQRAGVAYALDHGAALIGDEMGLGKTVQALGVVNADPSIKKILVICPLSVALNWQMEAQKWLVRDLSVGIASSKELPDADVVVAHWGIIANHASSLRKRSWDLIVLDEAHYAKNPKAARTRAIFGGKELQPLQARRKLALTGTPIPNRPVEIQPILKWLAPSEFGNWVNFVKRYCEGYQSRFGWEVSGASHLDELQARLRSTVMIRRLKKDVLTDLPAKTRQVILLSADDPALRKALTAEEKAIKKSYEAIEKAEAALELAKSDTDAQYQEAVKALRGARQLGFTEMSKVRHETALAKVPRVLDHLRDILSDGNQKIVVFAHHRDVIEALKKGLETTTKDWLGINVVSIVGGDAAEDRQEAVQRFQEDPAVRVFIGSIGAAREGITLTAANLAVFAELDWVPGNLSQAEDRIHRIGQSDSVTVQHILLDKSIDATMVKKVIAKQEILDKALDQQKDIEVEIDEAEVLSEERPAPTTKSVTREEIAQRAEHLTDHEVSLVGEALKAFTAMDLDQGISKVDALIGHDLAKRKTLTKPQAALGAKLLSKYPTPVAEEAAKLWRILGKRVKGSPTGEPFQQHEIKLPTNPDLALNGIK